MSGKESGIYAIAIIETDPTQLSESPEERKYWLGNEENEVAPREDAGDRRERQG